MTNYMSGQDMYWTAGFGLCMSLVSGYVSQLGPMQSNSLSSLVPLTSD